jgi:hypothetical protein
VKTRRRSLAAGASGALRALAGLAVALAAAAPPGAAAAPVQAPEEAIKAAYVFNFGSYVDWPASAFATPESELVVAVVAAEEVAVELETAAAGRTVAGRPVRVLRLREDDEVPAAHVLFVGRAAARALPGLLESLGDRPTLAVTETEGALGSGSAINFVVEGDRVRFDIAPAAAERRGLKVSARLLSVARRVVEGAT